MHIIKPNLAKRSGAAVLDFIVLLLLTLTLQTFAVYPIFDSIYGLSALEADIKDVMMDSHLYVEDTTTLSPVDLAKDDLPTAIYDYYSDFKDGLVYKDETDPFIFSNEWYNTNILNIGSTDTSITVYFEYDLDDLSNPDPSKVGVAKASATATELETFYLAAYQDAKNDLLNYPSYFAMMQELFNLQIQIFVVALLFVLILLHLLVPLLFKNGQTLGKKLFSIGLATKEGYRIKYWQHLIRFVVFAIETLFGFYTVFVGYLIPYTFIVFSKNNRAPHDYAASTMIVDMKTSLIFSNKEEADAYDQKIEATTSAIKERKINFDQIKTDLPDEEPSKE